MPSPPKLCPTCQAPIPSDAPAGLCPACLLVGAAVGTQSMPGALASAPSVEELSAAFPDLEVLELIGHGGMGVIFKARQPRLDRLVALKILPPNLAEQPGFTERFTREARALARLNHPNIVAVYDFGERGKLCFLVMEFVNGVNLRQAMKAGVTPEQALALVPKICEALQFAHDRGVLHRDIKPENILVDTTGTPKLADFGIAKLAEENAPGHPLTMSGATLGTAAYMAPEQIEKPSSVDHRADIYSLGVVLYEMLTGELPLGRFANPSSKANVGAGVDDVVLRALEKERERRQQSATEMKTQVEQASTAPGVPPQLRNEDWVLRCPACGHITPFSQVGVRIGAASVSKRVFARCPQCGFAGMTPVIQAWQARSDGFVPDPLARQNQGRAFAIIGALLNIAPFVLITLAVWPLIDPSGTMRHPRWGEEAFVLFVIPAAALGVAALGLTAVALWVSRYRARWFFRWLISYGIVLAPLGIGVVILTYVIRCRAEFFADFERPSAVAPQEQSPEQASASVDDEEEDVVEESGFKRALLILTAITALLIPLAGANPRVGGVVSPGTLCILTAMFGAVYALWPGAGLRGQETQNSGSRWAVPLIFGAVTLPFGVLGGIFITRHAGFPPWAVIPASLVLPCSITILAALLGAAWRAVIRAGAPRWIAALLVLLLLLVAVFGLLVVAQIGYQQLQAPRDFLPAEYERG